MNLNQITIPSNDLTKAVPLNTLKS